MMTTMFLLKQPARSPSPVPFRRMWTLPIPTPHSLMLEQRRRSFSSSSSSSRGATEPPFLGALYHTQDYKAYGYLACTKEKFILVTDAAVKVEVEMIKALFNEIQEAYTCVVRSPFYKPQEEIKSSKFDATMQKIMKRL
eukprot:m.175527 g.175527  ORF g.175527 m.175527 type:complete len:139 (+) comp53320_c0_seq2:5721-6137(+)